MTDDKLPCAGDFMNQHVHTVTPEMSLADIITFLQKHEISSAPVVELEPGGQRVLVGFVSERDCLDYLSNEIFFGSPAQPQTAGTIMKRHPVCISPSIDIFTLASILVSHGYRHLPVVEERRLVGIVSRRDILKALDRYYREVIRHRDQERFPPDVHEIMHHRFLVR